MMRRTERIHRRTRQRRLVSRRNRDAPSFELLGVIGAKDPLHVGQQVQAQGQRPGRQAQTEGLT